MVPSNAEVQAALISPDLNNAQKILLNATSEQMEAEITALLKKTANNSFLIAKLLNTLLEKLSILDLEGSPDRYMTACMTVFDKKPILLINAALDPQVQPYLFDSVLKKRDTLNAEKLFLFFHKHRINIEGKIRLFKTSEKNRALLMQDFFPWIIKQFDLTLLTHPQETKELLAAIMSGVDQQLMREYRAYLYPDVSAHVLHMLSLFTHEDLKNISCYTHLLNDILILPLESPLLDYEPISLQHFINDFSNHFYHFRIFSMQYINEKESAIYPLINAHAQNLIPFAMKLVEKYPDIFKQENDPNGATIAMMSRFYISIKYLGNSWAHSPWALQKLLTVLNGPHQKGQTSPLEDTLTPDLEKLIKDLKKKYESVEINLEKNVNCHGFQLDFCITVIAGNAKKIINVEVDTHRYHGSPSARVKNLARDMDLKNENTEVLRLQMDNTANYTLIQDTLIRYINQCLPTGPQHAPVWKRDSEPQRTSNTTTQTTMAVTFKKDH